MAGHRQLKVNDLICCSIVESILFIAILSNSPDGYLRKRYEYVWA